VVDAAIAGRLIRYTLVIAVPAFAADEEGDALAVTTCGNATRNLTRLMMTDALLKIVTLPALRRDEPK